MAFLPSKYQQAIFDWIVSGIGNAIVRAVAGSGKTTTLLKCLALIPQTSKAIFLAFNKSIAMELQSKVPSNVQACTLNSLGNTIIKNNLGYKKIVAWKTNLVMDYFPQLLDPRKQKGLKPDEKARVYKEREMIKKMVSITKATLLDWTNNEEVALTMDKYNIDFEMEILPLYRRVMEKCLSDDSIIDFDDQLWLPVVKGMQFPKYDWIFVDEAQDLNRCQIEFVLRLKGKKSRVVAVGDPRQSIYMFRGADTEAMDRIENALQATQLPLSICYRCPKSVVELAQEIEPDIEYAPNAIDGVVDSCTTNEMHDKLTDGNSLILCRINASLVSCCLNLIAKGRKATIQGREIGSQLVSIVKGLRTYNLDDMYDALDIWEQKQLKALARRKASESQVQLVTDKAECIRIIADSCDSVKCVENKIEKLFDDRKSGIKLSSVHKAKGLEGDNIFIIRPDLMPLQFKNANEEQLEQEYNIKYVAHTRAKKELWFVD